MRDDYNKVRMNKQDFELKRALSLLRNVQKVETDQDIASVAPGGAKSRESRRHPAPTVRALSHVRAVACAARSGGLQDYSLSV